MFGEREFLQYTHIDSPPLVSDRDFLIRGKVEANAGDRSLTLKLEPAEDPIKPPGEHVRGILRGLWKLESAEDGKKTLVTAEMHADPKGSIPKWIVNAFQKSWA